MNRDVKHAIKIAELYLQKSAACLDLLKTYPTHLGLIMAAAAAARFDKIIKETEFLHKNPGERIVRRVPIIFDETSAFTEEQWKAAEALIAKGPTVTHIGVDLGHTGGDKSVAAVHKADGSIEFVELSPAKPEESL